jgi:hypothetical protein
LDFSKGLCTVGLVVGKGGCFFLLMKSLSTSSTAFNYCIVAVVILRLHRGAMYTSSVVLVSYGISDRLRVKGTHNNTHKWGWVM